MSGRWTIYPPSAAPREAGRPEDAHGEKCGDIQRDIGGLSGSTLTAISVEPFRVEFSFLTNELDIRVSMQKSFRCSLDAEPFDPTQEHPDGRNAAFIGLRGRKCVSVALTAANLRLTFETGDTLDMELLPTDFEPFHLSGYSNVPASEWLFFYTAPTS